MTQEFLGRPISDIEFVAFDTETTGLVPAHERIVEVSGVRFRAGEEIGTFETLVDPGRPIPEASARVHGIRDADVEGQPDAGQALEGFAAFVEGAVMLAHNAEFDVSFLAHEAARHRTRLPEVPVLDTVEISRSLRADLPNHKLETISKALGCPAPAYHRALADSRTLMQCFETMVTADLADRSGEDLLALTSGALSFGPDERLWMWLPAHLRPIEDALRQGSVVTILYEPEGKRSETRDVRPQAWIRRPGATYLMAHCDRDRSDRSYRLDWIRRAQYAQATLF